MRHGGHLLIKSAIASSAALSLGLRRPDSIVVMVTVFIAFDIVEAIAHRRRTLLR